MGPFRQGRVAGEAMKLDYDIDQRLSLAKSVLFGVQWAALLVPSIIILGIAACNVHSLDAQGQISYLQKLFS